MTIDYTKITAKELVQKVKSGEIDSCTYSTKAELYEGMRKHAVHKTKSY